MILTTLTPQSPLRQAITRAYRMDETIALNHLLPNASFSPTDLTHIRQTAEKLLTVTRQMRKQKGGLDAFLHEYDLSSDEGVALMCLAEALLRIPDQDTMDRLISDKISTAEWEKHLKRTDSLFVNAATWSLLLTGKVLAPTLSTEQSLGASLKRFFSRSSSAVIRPVVLRAMRLMGKQFVIGETIHEALANATAAEQQGYRHSFDMLGEAARTKEDAERYFKSYQQAIAAIGEAAAKRGPIQGSGISVKLSALHPRYEFAKHAEVVAIVSQRLLDLSLAAKTVQINLTVDAEEADRLDLSLDIIEKVFSNPALNGWNGFGLAVQSYQKRAPFVIDWLVDLAKRNKRRLMVRLIKGAYWDTEIKLSQMQGFDGYPVFTRKNSTDVSFIACAKQLFAHTDVIYPQFGTHNAYSVAAVLQLAGSYRDFEFQCLYGMGAPLYDQIVAQGIPCRVYAPVGTHKDLLSYLVRRLLENGANTSFINRIADDSIPVTELLVDPATRIANLNDKPHPFIPLPRDIYKKIVARPALASEPVNHPRLKVIENETRYSQFNVERLNSPGLDLSNVKTLLDTQKKITEALQQTYESGPLLNGELLAHTTKLNVIAPEDRAIIVGTVYPADAADVDFALKIAEQGAALWAETPIDKRSATLERAADLLEAEMPTFLALLAREGGKQIQDGIGEVREAIDFCRYYAARARVDLAPQELKGPTGQKDTFSLHPRGIIACISPWNFPIAIFMGQIVAALAAGNAVIAKPAEQTPLIAAAAVRLLQRAGIPNSVLQLLPGSGEVVGAKLVADPRIAGVMFTGSTETAKLIQKTLADRSGPIIPFIAETGGLNAMIVDSSALIEQVVQDVIQSAFNSAGQRCSALRILYVQEDIADSLLTMLKGAMAELTLGDPLHLNTDVGPVIDADALKMLQDHARKLSLEALKIAEVQLPDNLSAGHYFAPCVFELKDLSLLPREVFGPILHVIRYSAKNLDQVIAAIIETGYGLTFGIHSRINATIDYVTQRVPIGNIYVNRNMIGAVVGVQPFGGEKLSGTGPKAGGPYYLPRLCTERAISVNTTAAGGNTLLVSLAEGD